MAKLGSIVYFLSLFQITFHHKSKHNVKQDEVLEFLKKKVSFVGFSSLCDELSLDLSQGISCHFLFEKKK